MAVSAGFNFNPNDTLFRPLCLCLCLLIGPVRCNERLCLDVLKTAGGMQRNPIIYCGGRLEVCNTATVLFDIINSYKNIMISADNFLKTRNAKNLANFVRQYY